MIRLPLFAGLTVSLLSLTLAGCSSNASADHTETASADTSKNPITDLLSGATLGTARFEEITNELTLTGKVAINADQMVKVFPLVGGHIETVRAELGDYVQKGQVLAVLRSGDLADLEQAAVNAKSQLAVALKNAQITQDMAKNGFSSQRDLLTAQEQLTAAKGEVARVAERRRILGGNGSTYIVKAPMSGFVVEKTAAPGMELRADDPENLFTLANLSQVWILANVYESDLANVHVGQLANITTLSYPDRVLHGKIDKIFNVLDPTSKTLKVRITLQNADYLLKPEMFATVGVLYPGRDQRVAIPAEAIVFDKSRNFVVMVNTKNQPVVREITIFKTIGTTTYLNSGLKSGDRVVTKNQLLVYNALGN